MSEKATLPLKPGTEVLYNGRKCHITHLLDLGSVLVADAETGLSQRIKISDIAPIPPSVPLSTRDDLNLIQDEDWKIAQERYEIIRPLLDSRGRRREDVENRARAHGLHANTLYKWLSKYETEELVTTLLPKERTDKGVKKLTPVIEAIVESTIQDEYLNKQRKKISKVYSELKKRCYAAKVPVPHCNTLRNRIAKLSDNLRISRRHGAKKAEERFSPKEKSFSGADHPLSVIQIDHTKLDIMLVDDIHRRVIGRPWITLAIDVFSRAVTGFYVSFDPPGSLSTGLCVAHSILPKEKWLAKLGLSSEWPIWGIPAQVHADNAKEFRGNMLKRSCQQYGINLEWRPVKRPHYGGHIERLIGTFVKEVHTLPGTTFSNVQEKGDYKSEEMAALTLTEFELWLTTFLVDVYHRRIHSALNISPLDKFREGIFGTPGKPGTGLPDKIVDEATLRLDFMPFVERTVQDDGVVIDDIHYYHDVLRSWINTTEPDKPRVKRKFIFRRDPRDISTVWFFDPQLKTYYAIPYRDTSHPPISIWELREAKKVAKGQNEDEATERNIFDAYERMREIEEKAKGETKSARRAGQRRKTGIEAAANHIPLQTKVIPEVPQPLPQRDIKPFDELDDLSDED